MMAHLKSLFNIKNKNEKRVEEKIRGEEKIKVTPINTTSQFINEVKKNYYIYSSFIPSIYRELDSNSEIYLEKYNDDSITMKIFIQMYKDTIDINSMYEFISIVDKQYIRAIINKYFNIEQNLIELQFSGDLTLKADLAFKVLDSNIQMIFAKEKYDEIIKLIFLNEAKSGSTYTIMRNFQYISLDVEEFLNNPYDSLSSYYTLSAACINECGLFFYIYSIIKLIIISRIKFSILDNIELKKIFYNLYTEFRDVDIIYEKMCKIYDMNYFNDEDKLNEVELKSLIKFLMIDEENDLNNYDFKYNIEIIRNEIKKGSEEESIISILKHLIFNENNIEYRNNIENFEEVVYIKLLNILCLEISYLDVIKIYRYKEVILRRINEIIVKFDTIKEKERILNKKFIPANNVDKKKLNIENVSNGHDFEWYLKYIFELLGYRVEVTKGSGDQGADLIMNKNGIKFVVQAKFYSSPVTNKAIQEVVASIKYYNANKAIVVTNSIFTDSAIKLGGVNDVEMIDGEELRRIITRLGKDSYNS